MFVIDPGVVVIVVRGVLLDMFLLIVLFVFRDGRILVCHLLWLLSICGCRRFSFIRSFVHVPTCFLHRRLCSFTASLIFFAPTGDHVHGNYFINWQIEFEMPRVCKYRAPASKLTISF